MSLVDEQSKQCKIPKIESCITLLTIAASDRVLIQMLSETYGDCENTMLFWTWS